MKDTIRLALVQLTVSPLAPSANLERILSGIEEASRDGVDLVCLPELANLGQVPSFDVDFASRYAAAAETLDGAFVGSITALARDRGVHVAVGVAEADRDVRQRLFNAAVLIDGNGGVVAVQHKLHLPGAERHYFARGDDVVVADTDLGRLTTQICYDLYFPEVARLAALRGAEVLCGVANIPHREDWPNRLPALASVRAYENQQHVAIVNSIGAAHGLDYGGESVVAEPPGRITAQAPLHEPAIVTASPSYETLLAARVRRPVFSDRRPDVYGGVVDVRGPRDEGMRA